MNKNKSNGAAMRSEKRNQEDASKILRSYLGTIQNTKKPAFIADSNDKLKITFLGGLRDVGEKNMAIIEYQNDAIVLDCGMSLGVVLPGINYEINDITYLKSIKHKLRGYVITHGHLDHMGGLKHIVQQVPAPIYGSRFTIGVIEKSFEEITDFKPILVTAKMDVQERLTIGSFTVEFIRVTHSLPDASAISIDTPAGRIIATGDFRLDPEPLDKMPTDTKRLKQLGDEGVLLLLSESSYTEMEGRVPTESTLQQSFYDIIDNAPGRIFVAAFSSNMNRTQMIINAAVASGRKVALDGRGMLSYAEIAVRQGILKVPKGTIIPITQTTGLTDNKLLVMCTGGQGEPNAALQRMSEGEHRSINLKPGDTVVISSSPIPGNEIAYNAISNRLAEKGVHLYRHTTHEIDGCGPLHVSGHARRDELREMIQMIRPKYLIPVHGGVLRRRYHAELGIESGMQRKNIILPQNGDSLFVSHAALESAGQVPHASILIDQSGKPVSITTVKDRLLLSETGIITAILNIQHRSGELLKSPDIISRGFMSTQDSSELMNMLGSEIKRATSQRYNRLKPSEFKSEIHEHIARKVFEHTGLSPVIVVVVNTADEPKLLEPKTHATNQDQRFQEMRNRLLTQRRAN